MERKDIERILADELIRVAPEIDLGAIDRSADLREELDIDSIDFLNLVAALSRRLNIPIPEADYHLMDSLAHIADYLDAHAVGATTERPVGPGGKLLS